MQQNVKIIKIDFTHPKDIKGRVGKVVQDSGNYLLVSFNKSQNFWFTKNQIKFI